MALPLHYDTVAITNLAAYKRNIKKIISYIGKSVRLMAVVKANAYGHGMVECAQAALEVGASMLGVAHASEGMKLRRAGITAPVLVLATGLSERLSTMIEHNLTISLTSFDMLADLKKKLKSGHSCCKVHIKVDTGMGRDGVLPPKAPELVEQACNSPGVSVEGIFSHFPSADEDKDQFTSQQIETFTSLLENLEKRSIRPAIAHLCNSAGTLKFPEAHLDLVRPGIMTYGLIPYPGSEEKIAFEPVLAWESKIAFIKEVPAGFPVSYGNTFITKRPSRLATVPVGYADGYNRQLSNKGKAIVNGNIVPVIGRVCMDLTVFDVTDVGEVHAGDTITLIGSQENVRVAAEDLAEKAGTITHEIVTGITGRVSRTFIKTA